MISSSTGTFAGHDGLRLHYQVWQPTASPRAVLAIIPGDGDHIGRYYNLVDALLPAGYSLAGYDRRGNGRSEGPRGFIHSSADYHNDHQRFMALLTEMSPGVPIFLYGHSGGALVALDFVLRSPSGLAGCVLSGIGLEPVRSGNPLMQWLFTLVSLLYPRFTPRSAPQPQALTRDPAQWQAYAADPLVHSLRSARLRTESRKAAAWAAARPAGIRLPILFIHGAADPFCSAAAVQRYFERIPFSDKSLNIYPGALHEPHNDSGHDRVLSDLRLWLDSHS